MRFVFVRWAALGILFSGLLLFAQARELGGITALLQVGEHSPVRELIVAELGEVPLVPALGHDGQIYYAIGLDLSGDLVGPLLDFPDYRYRRILFPLLASGFGLLDGHALLIGMIVVTVLSMSIATGTAAVLAVRTGLSELVGLSVLFNPGAWLAIRLLTGDMLAIALMLLGLLAFASKRLGLSASGLAASVLAKDAYLITPLGLSLTKNPRRWQLAAVPIVVLFLWVARVRATLGGGFTGQGNLGPPFVGLLDSWPNWARLEGGDTFYLSFALLTLLVGLVLGVSRRSWLRWPVLGWAALGLVVSSWVWDYGNNAARVLAPLAVLVALSFGQAEPPTTSRRNFPV